VPGGFVDIEFTVQFLLLRHGATVQEPVSANTGAAIGKIESCGLLAPVHAQALLEAWRLQSRLAQFISVSVGGSLDSEAVRAPFRKRLAAAVELPDFAMLERSLLEHQSAAHAAMLAVIKA
jgi:[glutamine synthetase] adenylyltransferase / [glutamine synthetase]-adenylyl-L-tyrosine phosphorylase